MNNTFHPSNLKPPFLPFSPPRLRIILLILFCIVAVMISSCEKYETIDKAGITSLKIPDNEENFLSDWLETNELTAFVIEKDSNIYVEKESVDDIKKALNANISNGVWHYQNAYGDSIQRIQKPLDIKLYANKVGIIKWSFAKGYKCQELPKDYIVPIHQAGKSDKKPIVGYQTIEKGNWCLSDKRYSCKFSWQKLTAEFIKVNKRGNLRKKKGKYLRHKKTTIDVMVCIP